MSLLQVLLKIARRPGPVFGLSAAALCCWGLPLPAQATEAFQTKYEGLADVKIYATESEQLADCVIYITQEASEAEDRFDVWYLQEDRGLADVKFYVTDSEMSADYRIFFVKQLREVRCNVDWKSKRQ